MEILTLQECAKRLDAWSDYGRPANEREIGIITTALIAATSQEGLDAFAIMQAEVRRASNTIKRLLEMQSEIDNIQGRGWEITQ